MHPDEKTIIREMLQQSIIPYGEDEIDHLVGEIIRTCKKENTPITKELADHIKEDMEDRYKKRQLKQKQTSRNVSLKRQRARTSIYAPRFRTKDENRNTETNGGENMESLERMLSKFQGCNDHRIRSEDVVQLLADALNISLYNHLQKPEKESIIHKLYSGFRGNEEFWNDALNDQLSQGMRIKLQNFHLTEWIPFAPGRYFTPEAIMAREEAKHYVSHSYPEYLPLGKLRMILGGVGSIRLGAKTIRGREVYPLCVTSTGVSHQGIPIVLPEEQHSEVVSLLKEPGGCLVDVIGHLKICPKDGLPICYDKQIPRYFLHVEDIRVLQPSEELLVTVAITFTARERDSSENFFDFVQKHKKWSFCSFNPVRQNLPPA